MCAAIVFEVKPLNVTLTWSVCAAASNITVARPVPGVATGGPSFAPERLAEKVIGFAVATVDGNAKAAIIISAGETLRIQSSKSWLPPAPNPGKAEFIVGGNYQSLQQ
jgi:hypothetical protein